MIFGKKNILAIETEKETSVFCTFCLWLKGHMVGDLKSVAVTGAVIESLEFFLSKNNNRIDDKLYTLRLDKLTSIIYDSVFGDDIDSTSENILVYHRRFSPMIFSPNLIETLDGHFVVVVSSKDGERVLWKSLCSDLNDDVWIDSGEFERIIQDACNWLKL